MNSRNAKLSDPISLRAAATGLVSAVSIYVAQSVLGTAIAGPEFRESAPSWGSPWWIGAALLFGLALAVGLERFAGGVTIALTMIAWLLPTVIAAVVMTDSAVAAINLASVSILFAFTLHLSGWVALLIAILAVLLSLRGTRPLTEDRP